MSGKRKTRHLTVIRLTIIHPLAAELHLQDGTFQTTHELP